MKKPNCCGALKDQGTNNQAGGYSEYIKINKDMVELISEMLGTDRFDISAHNALLLRGPFS